MKRILPFSLFSLFLLSSWFFFSSYSDKNFGIEWSGGPANSGSDKTGGPLSGGSTCAQCHSGGPGTTTMAFELLNSSNVAVTSYVPGGTYTVRHQVSSSLSLKAFQSVALLAANAQAGTFTAALTPQSQIKTLSGKQYIEHSAASPSGLFEFTWTAPAAGSGNVTFYSASNGLNGNGGTSGDTPGAAISNVITQVPWGTFSYGSNDFCDNDSDPAATITGVMGGTFSAGAGITVDPTTGTIDMSASSPGTYTITYTFTNGATTQVVNIGETYATTDATSICATDSIFLAGAWQNTAGIYPSTLQSVLGCDSVVTTTLTIIPVSSWQTTATICDGESIVIGGATYTTAGSYSYVIPNAAGCDSTITTTLTVNPTYDDTITETICAGDSTLFAGTWYSATGMYTENGSTVLSCDSITTLDLTVSPLDLSVTNTSPMLMSAQAGGTYQWLDCGAGFAPITGATGQSYTATVNGTYAVKVTFQNCTDTSVCETVAGIGLEELSFGQVKLFPNPSNGKLGLVFNQSITASLNVFDLSGKMVFTDQLNAQQNYSQNLSLESGTYIVRLRDGENQTQILWVIN